MASKDFEVPGIGLVSLYKRHGSRSLRLSVTGPGKVRLTMPYWTPYAAGLSFIATKKEWLRQQLDSNDVAILKHGQAIGKAHHLQFLATAELSKSTSRLSTTTITIKYPIGSAPESIETQAVARRACLRALKREAEQLLPQRLASLAKQEGYTYKSITVKQLKRRWGSCDQHKNIVLNLFLMQLPWHLIDYVIIHELVHTHHLNHSKEFWDEMKRKVPALATIRKAMRAHRPQLVVQA